MDVRGDRRPLLDVQEPRGDDLTGENPVDLQGVLEPHGAIEVRFPAEGRGDPFNGLVIFVFRHIVTWSS